MSLRVIVCGGRMYDDFEAVLGELEALEQDEVIVVHGGARGADALAEQAATVLGYGIQVFPADWSLGRRAGPLRNQQMVDAGADLVIAFPGSNGTADCVRRARAAGIPINDRRA